MKRVSIRTYHDTRQPNKTNGRWPVKLVVYCAGLGRKQYALHWPDGEKCEATPDEYHRATLQRVPKDARPLAALIQHETTRAREIVEQMTDFSHEAFARQFVGGTDPLDLIADLESKAATFRTGSGANYRSAAAALRRYTGRPSLNYYAITPAWARDFVTALETDLSGDTVRLYVGLINTMIKQRRTSKTLRADFQPFAGIKFRKKKALRVTPVDLKDWLSLMEYTSPDERKQYARDVFVLCTLLNGIYAADVLRIRRDQVQGEWVRLAREKTGGEFVAYITPPIREILDRLPPSMPFIFPFLRPEMDGEAARRAVATFGERINHSLRDVAKDLRMKRFTLRQARDTFATLSRNLGTREEVVSQLLAHSDLRTTKHYLGKFADDEIRENARRIAGM